MQNSEVKNALYAIKDYITEQKIKTLFFPGKSGHFLYSILQKFKNIINGTEKNIINESIFDFDVLSEVNLINFPFSGKPGLIELEWLEYSFSNDDRIKLFTYWNSLGFESACNEKIAVVDSMAQGYGIRSFIHTLQRYVEHQRINKNDLTISFVGIKNFKYAYKNDRVVVKNSQITFNETQYKSPNGNGLLYETMRPNTFSFKEIRFPIPHDDSTENGNYGGAYALCGSLYPRDWSKLPELKIEQTEKALWFFNSFVPEYISQIFN